MHKRLSSNNELNDGNQNGDGTRDAVWILPFMIIGAMFGSLVGARIGHALGQPTPLGPALIGVVVGILLVAAIGLLAARSEQSS